MRHRSHVGRIDTISHVEQATAGGLLDEVVEHLINDVFELSEKAIDRISQRWSIEPTTEPDERVLEFSFNGADTVNVLVVAPMETLLDKQTTAGNKMVWAI